MLLHQQISFYQTWISGFTIYKHHSQCKYALYRKHMPLICLALLINYILFQIMLLSNGNSSSRCKIWYLCTGRLQTFLTVIMLYLTCILKKHSYDIVKEKARAWGWIYCNAVCTNNSQNKFLDTIIILNIRC